MSVVLVFDEEVMRVILIFFFNKEEWLVILSCKFKKLWFKLAALSFNSLDPLIFYLFSCDHRKNGFGIKR